jgi:ParB-like chromosome segregation protein Spo0J
VAAMAKFGDVFKGTDVKKTDNRPRSETRWLHYTKLIDNTDQYRKSATEEDIVAFAELIKSAGKVLQDLLVRKSGTDTYEIIAGHHRRLACKYLVEVEGLKEFEFLPCKVENVDDVQAEFQLYATNGFMPKTDAEKLHEIERIKYLLDTYPDQFKQEVEERLRRLHVYSIWERLRLEIMSLVTIFILSLIWTYIL